MNQQNITMGTCEPWPNWLLLWTLITEGHTAITVSNCDFREATKHEQYACISLLH